MSAKILTQKYFNADEMFGYTVALAPNLSKDTSYETTVAITNWSTATAELVFFIKNGGVSANELGPNPYFDYKSQYATLSIPIGVTKTIDVILPPDTGLYAPLSSSLFVTAIGKKV